MLIKSMYCMTMFGVGELISGLVVGPLIDNFGSRKIAAANFFIIAIMTAVTLYSVKRLNFDGWSFVMCLFWGL